MARIYRYITGYAFKPLRLELQTKAGSSILKLAVSVLGTMGAIKVVMTEKELKGGIPEPLDFGAGSNWSISAFDFHKAEAAGSKRWIGFSYGA
jgi:hypothetical protein